MKKNIDFLLIDAAIFCTFANALTHRLGNPLNMVVFPLIFLALRQYLLCQVVLIGWLIYNLVFHLSSYSYMALVTLILFMVYLGLQILRQYPFKTWFGKSKGLAADLIIAVLLGVAGYLLYLRY